jgi:predicted nucleic acid-binding Zn ribbon protein
MIDISKMDFDDLKKCMKDQTYEQCPECKAYLVWKDIPDENVITIREYHGQPNLTPEVQVMGYICTECGTRIYF